MSDKNDQVERLMRLREQQLKARDPHAKQRATRRKVTARRQRLRKQQGTFLDMLIDVPYRWQGIVLGAVLGMLISIALPTLVSGAWVEYAGLGAVLFLALLGFAFGQAFDARDELRNLLDE